MCSHGFITDNFTPFWDKNAKYRAHHRDQTLHSGPRCPVYMSIFINMHMLLL